MQMAIALHCNVSCDLEWHRTEGIWRTGRGYMYVREDRKVLHVGQGGQEGVTCTSGRTGEKVIVYLTGSQSLATKQYNGGLAKVYNTTMLAKQVSVPNEH